VKNSKSTIEEEIKKIEGEMNSPDFWTDKNKAQAAIKRLNEFKDELLGKGKYDKGNAIITIFSGAGGDDAEDFSAILYKMYLKFADQSAWISKILHKNENDHGGFRNITFEVIGDKVYGTLKGESGVHRLVRVSPFSAKKLRHTSFSMVEVIPKFEKTEEIDIPEKDLKVEFSKSGGPGGQNVNKRETAVRVVHIPTGISAHCESERSQAQNKERAGHILKGKLYKFEEDNRKKKEQGFYVSKTTEAEWGNQIRSYVLHPYKLVKDHRTGIESKDPDGVFDGALDRFIEAEKKL